MNRRSELQKILEVNNQIIQIKTSNPNDYFKIKSARFKLSKRISNYLKGSESSNVTIQDRQSLQFDQG